MAMAEEKESTSIPLSQAENGSTDPEDPAKSPPSSPNSSTRKCIRRMGMLRSWDACLQFRKYCMLFCSPELVLEEVHDWMFVDGFFSPLYERLGVDIFAAVFSVGEWVIKQMPFVRHIYSASKQISAAISP
ncbi:hypothetical protein Gogos_003152, partial [Gossypium gossypioides]|nr:hypothetical protein [Gossypium gossypioides]